MGVSGHPGAGSHPSAQVAFKCLDGGGTGLNPSWLCKGAMLMYDSCYMSSYYQAVLLGCIRILCLTFCMSLVTARQRPLPGEWSNGGPSDTCRVVRETELQQEREHNQSILCPTSGLLLFQLTVIYFLKYFFL